MELLVQPAVLPGQVLQLQRLLVEGRLEFLGLPVQVVLLHLDFPLLLLEHLLTLSLEPLEAVHELLDLYIFLVELLLVSLILLHLLLHGLETVCSLDCQIGLQGQLLVQFFIVLFYL